MFVPKIDPAAAGDMNMLKIYGEEDMHSLPLGLWDIPDPAPTWGGSTRMDGR